MPYLTPLKDFRFALNELAGLDDVLKLPGFEEVTPDLVDAILEENGRFVEQAIAPLNVPGDTRPPVWNDGQVTATPGYAQGFKDYAAGGWQGLQHPQAWGGQGLPKLVAAAPGENIQAASLAFSLCPMLTDGVIEAILTVGSEEQRKKFVPNLIGGKWTGTMNLTEPQAGSDLAQVATRAVRQEDGSYRLSGQKIFITYGEHDLAENIIHLVLARTPDAPPGVKGISLFIVPKFLVGADGTLGPRNDVWCASLEHKLGIHGSPTAVLLYGSGKGEAGEGAVGYLVGELNRGLEYMFIMMNAARYSVGQQGIGVSERAYQHALAYARERVQGRAVEGSAAAVAIARHSGRAAHAADHEGADRGGACRVLCDGRRARQGHASSDPEQRARNRAFYEYMVPVVKGFSTESAVEVASLGVQVHGGMGYIEETGAAQYYRDARILPIYEGTTAIQANDLVSRKTQRDAGATAYAAIAAMRETLRAVEAESSRAAASERDGLRLLRDNLDSAIQAYEAGVEFILEQSAANIRAVYSSSVPYLMLAGVVHGGWQMARAVLACRRRLAAGSTDPFHREKLATGLFYAAHILPRALALSAAVRAGVVADACGAAANIA
ncbi:acyl-CoA dehydrogenase, middle domain-containing protein 5 [Achromobacter insuavis AXX-A]|uniref:3-methylmercaptopropionyl-CoA dehydrogenase n=2 Tax=Pseudomonadota TaxID=1224 RepID=F7T3X1_9BURK|nr:acyl-CoA dehydrogenase [Achromobacter insuavis]EGP44953.1 acyl-CoA dehydrogenase, middle domain-containing protein 5 [Achromobacter insuavis AXX-A]